MLASRIYETCGTLNCPRHIPRNLQAKSGEEEWWLRMRDDTYVWDLVIEDLFPRYFKVCTEIICSPCCSLADGAKPCCDTIMVSHTGELPSPDFSF